MSNYHRNKAAAVTLNVDPRTGEVLPSMTDQAGAKETDINVIVGKMIKTGGAITGHSTGAMFEDFSQLPDDFRGMIETARRLQYFQGELPEYLQNLSVQDLLNLSPQAAKDMLAEHIKATTPAPTPEGATT